MAQQQDTLGWDPTMCLVVVPLLYLMSVSIVSLLKTRKRKNKNLEGQKSENNLYMFSNIPLDQK